MTRRLGAIAYASGWAGLITGSEWLARRRLRSRSNAWLIAYGSLGAIALLAGARLAPRSRGLSAGALLVAALGYPLGNALLGDRHDAPAPDRFVHELGAIEMVACVEELTWGVIVEPALGRVVTAAAFASKHVVIDRRWRRSLGLFLFWMGLGAQRRRWPAAALISHCALNALGVLQGHVSGRDRF